MFWYCWFKKIKLFQHKHISTSPVYLQFTYSRVFLPSIHVFTRLSTSNSRIHASFFPQFTYSRVFLPSIHVFTRLSSPTHVFTRLFSPTHVFTRLFSPIHAFTRRKLIHHRFTERENSILKLKYLEGYQAVTKAIKLLPSFFYLSY